MPLTFHEYSFICLVYNTAPRAEIAWMVAECNAVDEYSVTKNRLLAGLLPVFQVAVVPPGRRSMFSGSAGNRRAAEGASDFFDEVSEFLAHDTSSRNHCRII